MKKNVFKYPSRKDFSKFVKTIKNNYKKLKNV